MLILLITGDDSMPNAANYIAPRMGHGWLAEAPDLHCRMVQAWLHNEPLPEELVRVGKP